MKTKYLITLLAIFFLSVTVAIGADFTVTGQTPTQREDNTSLGLSEISGFNMYCGVGGRQLYR